MNTRPSQRGRERGRARAAVDLVDGFGALEIGADEKQLAMDKELVEAWPPLLPWKSCPTGIIERLLNILSTPHDLACQTYDLRYSLSCAPTDSTSDDSERLHHPEIIAKHRASEPCCLDVLPGEFREVPVPSRDSLSTQKAWHGACDRSRVRYILIWAITSHCFRGPRDFVPWN